MTTTRYEPKMVAELQKENEALVQESQEIIAFEIGNDGVICSQNETALLD